jgi:threonine dehydrogenase-like Zn-dependent dehydrogenase
VPGGQAEYVRVPKANVGPLKVIPEVLNDEQVLFLSDILPTGYQAAVNGRWARAPAWPSSAPARSA